MILQSARSFRILDVAMVDYVATIITAFLISYGTKVPVVLTTILSFVLAIIFHIIFGVNTTTIKYLGLATK